MELPNTSSQAVELNPSCSGQAHPIGLASVMGTKTRAWKNFHSTNALMQIQLTVNHIVI